MKTVLCFLFVFVIGVVACKAQVLEKADEAFRSAGEEQKTVLLVFAGSDWCLPCIRFEKQIFGDSGFIRFARRELVLLRADFPQRKTLPSQIVAQNEDLAEHYNPRGIFPLFLLLKADKTILTSVDYHDQSATEFIDEIKSVLRSAHMLKEYTRSELLMGSSFQFIVLAENEARGAALLEDGSLEVKRIESLLTEFRDTSETARINRQAGIREVRVDAEVYKLIERCRNISQLAGGSFDITSGCLKKLYNFKGADFVLPGPREIRAAKEKTGFDKIKLSPPDKVFLALEGMHIGFGAVGKGYAADKVKALLQGKGVAGGVINASGDLTTWGSHADGEAWKTAIAHPDDLSRIIAWLPIKDLSIATSGNYIQYFDHQGRRYSHNIDPKTGYPVTGIKSVSVLSPSAELSDALATAVTVMGRKPGLHMIDQLPQTHCIIVDEHNNIFSSRKIDIRHAV